MKEVAGESQTRQDSIDRARLDVHTEGDYDSFTESLAPQGALMSKRFNIILPDATAAVLDRVAPRGNRSRFIDRAVLQFVKPRGTANLRERLKAGALANAALNLEIAQEWFPVEQEAWQRLEHEEQATAKATRGAARSTSRRSTQR